MTSLIRTLSGWLSRPGMALLARIALVSAFLVSGVVKALDFSGAMAEVRALAGIEPAAVLAVLVIATQLGGAALVIAGGRAAWIGAGLLAGFTVVATLLAHAFWTKTGIEQARDLATFFEHVGLVGGFLLASILVARSQVPAR
ncbi:MAG TPA: DoxX family protein [Vineibacter sp.]|nr:DoxX family protein [Vineibacter sp.]